MDDMQDLSIPNLLLHAKEDTSVMKATECAWIALNKIIKEKRPDENLRHQALDLLIQNADKITNSNQAWEYLSNAYVCAESLNDTELMKAACRGLIHTVDKFCLKADPHAKTFRLDIIEQSFLKSEWVKENKLFDQKKASLRAKGGWFSRAASYAMAVVA